jgi:putative membrane protein
VGRRRYVAALGVLLGSLALALAIAPHDRHDWLLENVLVAVFVAALAATWRRFPLSRVSYTLIFVFLCLHTVGAHYTYSLVPYDAWWERLTGRPLNALLGWERNNFDRVVHFGYGLLLAYPIREVFLRVASVKGFWGYFLPLDVTMSTSALYELIEWGAAAVFGGGLGAAFLGTQGDPWDAHKDMALASAGALLAMLATAALNAWLQRDFAQEWAESLRVKDRRPYGEDEIRRLREARNDAAPPEKPHEQTSPSLGFS